MKKSGSTQKALNSELKDVLMNVLRARFESHPARHKGISWSKVQARLEAQPDKMIALHEMESTGGEPDVVGIDKKTGEYLFYDCAPESPKGRRSLCYDRDALNARKEFKPKDSAQDMARAMNTTILSEAEYRYLQTLGEFDLKTSSWIETPDAIRRLGGALFCDRRYDHVFTYHNGAESYYAARAFRACLRL
jgi:hypothetical protein